MPRTHYRIAQEPWSAIADYASVPIAFEVRQRFRVVIPRSGLGGIQLRLERKTERYKKDYDAQPGQHPTEWARRFDVSRWGLLSAWSGSTRVGGTAIAWRTPDLDMLEGRTDLAVIWDLRVHPEWRRKGVGRALFRAGADWALAHGARWLKVETQNVNLPACRFYARMGCTLRAIDTVAYPSHPDEARLLWYKSLGA